MISITINEKQHKIPVTWYDVTYSDFISFQKFETNDFGSYFEYYTGITHDQFSLIEESVQYTLFKVMEFITDPDSLEIYEYALTEVNILSESWGKYERLLMYMKNIPDPLEAMIRIVEIYTGINISNFPIAEAIPISNFFIKQINEINDRYKELSTSFLTDKEELAMIDPSSGQNCFEGLGILATMEMLGYRANEYDEMLETIQLCNVLDTKLYNHRKSGYQKRLRDAMR